MDAGELVNAIEETRVGAVAILARTCEEAGNVARVLSKAATRTPEE